MVDTVNVGPRPRIWDYEHYTEMHLDSDSPLLDPAAHKSFGKFILDQARKAPVVIFLGEGK